MEKNHLTRHIALNPTIEEISKLECFIEDICDEYHIYDTYYGNILASLTLLFEMTNTTSKDDKEIEVYVHKTKSQLCFKILLYECFLDLAGLMQATENIDVSSAEELDNHKWEMLMVRMLSDELIMLPEEKAFMLTFYVAGINDPLTLQRIELLENYYLKIFQLQKTS